MIVGELAVYIIIFLIIVLIKAEIVFRKKVKYYRDLGYRHPEDQANRLECISNSFIQGLLLLLFIAICWSVIVHWNEPICIDN